MFLTPNVRYELSDNCELTLGDVVLCYEFNKTEPKTDDGSETEPDSDVSSPMMFGDAGDDGVRWGLPFAAFRYFLSLSLLSLSLSLSLPPPPLFVSPVFFYLI